MEKKEILFFVLFLAYWIIPLLYKKIMQKQKPAETKGLTLRILEFIATFKEASENERDPIGSHMNVQAQVNSQSAPSTVKMEEFVAPTAVRISAGEQHLKSTTTPLMKQTHAEISVPPKAPVRAQMKKRAGRKFPKQKLRDAILWAEILGKPVGLRDN